MNKKPKILLFDIETFANLAYVWGKYEQNVIDYEKEWYMLCFAYKWLDESSTKTVGLPHFPKSYKKDSEDDRVLCYELWKLFDEADIVIAHNGRSFDVKKANARFAYHGFPPPSPYKIVDTKEVAKKYFKFNSNKLDDLGAHFGLGRKIDTGGFDLWRGCVKGDMASWNRMLRYNRQDVILLEKIYKKLLPWMTNHPNLAQLNGDRIACPNCGSNNVQKRGIKYGYQSWWCIDCHAWPKSAIKEGSQIK